MSQVKEKPILFSAPMVRAILEGRKTVTRRAVKGSALNFLADFTLEYVALPENHFCPYGNPGDRLWVREAWVADAQVDAIAPRDLSQGEPIQYPADGAVRQTGCSMVTPGKTRPSIHMPRWASRILLEITDVRVERLQDITEEQALAEGIGTQATESFRATGVERPAGFAFRDLWASTGGEWEANPWVWVVEFKRVTP
ncbi:Phage protein [Pseudomonas synxantha]|uniref:Phage protein n=1 Tax=Pseudomonas synxantha TaxID=47883 RepID=A0A3G7U9B7_9PSED|nr:hypothetical protein [Pseudomonas synxantha]AZE55947.1 Phage protein [Pseudomonas synxantha]